MNKYLVTTVEKGIPPSVTRRVEAVNPLSAKRKAIALAMADSQKHPKVTKCVLEIAA